MYRAGTLYQLDLNTLRPDPDQPRKYLDPQALEELAASMRTHGVLQPVLVREIGEEACIIVSGERRYQAARLAGLATIPALVTTGEPAEIAIIENLLRENLTAIEEAEAIERLRAVHDYGLAELAAALGKADSTISEILSLNRLPAEVKDDCRGNAKALRSILTLIARQKTPEQMVELYGKYKESGLTVGEVRRRTVAKAVRKPLSVEDVTLWAKRLGTVVTVDMTAEQKEALALELENLRSVAYQTIRILRG